MTSQNFFLNISVFYWWRRMKNIQSPNLVGIGSWGPKIRPHKYLISPFKISINSCQIWCVREFHYVLLKNGHKMLKCKKKTKQNWWCHISVLYSVGNFIILIQSNKEVFYKWISQAWRNKWVTMQQSLMQCCQQCNCLVVGMWNNSIH